MQELVHIKTTKAVNASINIPASKSESNRALMINALSHQRSTLHNLSQSNDTKLMMEALSSKNDVANVEDAGTVMRFAAAYFSLGAERRITLKGTDRMHQRPIGILVDVLNSLGADVQYLGESGFPPLAIEKLTRQKLTKVSIDANISSQYISALLMIAPLLPEGLHLKLQREVASRPYIDLTLGIMSEFGIDYRLDGAEIQILPQLYQPIEFRIDGDWSGASYWYAIAAIADVAEISLTGLKEKPLQGDAVLVSIMEELGVTTKWKDGAYKLSKGKHNTQFTFNFQDYPDLAPTIAVVCAAKGIPATLAGLHSLHIKETDRVEALQTELSKLGVKTSYGLGTLKIESAVQNTQVEPITTYRDHRMAMAFTPLACLFDISIQDPMVVGKSYPTFWDDLKLAGFTPNFQR